MSTDIISEVEELRRLKISLSLLGGGLHSSG